MSAAKTVWLSIVERMGRFFWDGEECPHYTDGSPADPEGEIHAARNLSMAKLLTSKVGEDRHVVALDIDMPVTVVPSSTEGHYHLYIDHEMDTETYLELVDALAKAGVVEQGYAHMARVRKMTRLRTPWTSKLIDHHPNPEYRELAVNHDAEISTPPASPEGYWF